MEASEEILVKKLGGQIRAKRKELGWTQGGLAERGRLHRSYVADVELGRRNISIILLERIARALGVSISYLCREIDSGPGSEQR